MFRLRFVFALVLGLLIASSVESVDAFSGALPTSVCSDGNGYHTIYSPHSAGSGTYMQTWGELFCNQTNRYHKLEIYYYYATIHEWKRVAVVDRYTTSNYDTLVLNQCAAPSSSAHAWQARSKIGGADGGRSAVVYPNVKIAADGSC